MNRRRNAVLLSLSAVLTGCATSAGTPYEKAAVTPGKAVVYVYRPAALAGSALTPKVVCAGYTVALRPGSYHAFSVDPGHVGRTSSYADPGNHEKVDLEVTPQHDYYIKETIGMGIFIGRVHIASVDQQYGEEETRSCRQLQ